MSWRTCPLPPAPLTCDVKIKNPGHDTYTQFPHRQQGFSEAVYFLVLYFQIALLAKRHHWGFKGLAKHWDDLLFTFKFHVPPAPQNIQYSFWKYFLKVL